MALSPADTRLAAASEPQDRHSARSSRGTSHRKASFFTSILPSGFRRYCTRRSKPPPDSGICRLPGTAPTALERVLFPRSFVLMLAEQQRGIDDEAPQIGIIGRGRIGNALVGATAQAGRNRDAEVNVLQQLTLFAV